MPSLSSSRHFHRAPTSSGPLTTVTTKWYPPEDMAEDIADTTKKADAIIDAAKKEVTNAVDEAKRNASVTIAIATAEAEAIINAAKKIKAEKEAIFSKYSYDKLQKIVEAKIKPIELVDDLDHESYFTASKKILKPIEQIRVEIKPSVAIDVNNYSHPILKYMKG